MPLAAQKHAYNEPGGCLACGRCGGFQILDTFNAGTVTPEVPRKGFGIAIDIGTTTVVMALLDLETGLIKARHSFFNPQRIFAGDVISRVQAANEGHLDKMRQLITESILKGIAGLLEFCLIKDIAEIVIAGNTAMIHLLLGFSCECLGVSPFKINRALKDRCTFGEIFHYSGSQPGNSGINISHSLPVKIIPWFSSFIGGDVMSGLLSVMPRGLKKFLYIDLGTSGEMALFNEGKLTAASAAAGPAFESACIPSAGESGGIHGRRCASGVISGLAELVREGIVDKSGLLSADYSLALQKNTGEFSRRAVFSRKQIRDLQAAKSAVRSALDILLEDSGMDFCSIDAVYLAGGIGQAINADDAAVTGLIPKEIALKCQAAGNASLAGAARVLLSPLRANEDAASLVRAFTEISLAGHPRFNDLFAENMLFI